VNIINFITVASSFVIKIWLTNDTIDSLMAVSTVNTNTEWVTKQNIHRFSPVVTAVDIHPMWLMDE
jgi:hypothetical protein